MRGLLLVRRWRRLTEVRRLADGPVVSAEDSDEAAEPLSDDEPVGRLAEGEVDDITGDLRAPLRLAPDAGPAPDTGPELDTGSEPDTVPGPDTGPEPDTGPVVLIFEEGSSRPKGKFEPISDPCAFVACSESASSADEVRGEAAVGVENPSSLICLDIC